MIQLLDNIPPIGPVEPRASLRDRIEYASNCIMLGHHNLPAAVEFLRKVHTKLIHVEHDYVRVHYLTMDTSVHSIVMRSRGYNYD
jgi:hypothetical protein